MTRRLLFLFLLLASSRRFQAQSSPVRPPFNVNEHSFLVFGRNTSTESFTFAPSASNVKSFHVNTDENSKFPGEILIENALIRLSFDNATGLFSICVVCVESTAPKIIAGTRTIRRIFSCAPNKGWNVNVRHFKIDRFAYKEYLHVAVLNANYGSEGRTKLLMTHCKIDSSVMEDLLIFLAGVLLVDMIFFFSTRLRLHFCTSFKSREQME